MVQTQIASMFLGNPYVPDAEDRLKGITSLLSAQIHVIDGQSDHGIILDYITAKDVIEDEHKKSFEETIETFDFTTYADRSFSEHLEKRNRLIIPDDDGTLREFVIFESAMELGHEVRKVDVYANASYEELSKAAVIYPGSYKGSATQHGGRVLDDTGWQMGHVEAGGDITIENNTHTHPLEMLKRIAREFDLELRFRVEHNGRFVVGRYVDMLERIGEWRGREVVFGKDLEGIRRTESQDIVTALLGIGPEDSDGNRIEVLVEDDDALKRWGRRDRFGKLHHLIEPYEIESDRGDDMTKTEARRYTRTALDKRLSTQVEYETTIIDLENVPGLESKKIRFGDTIRIKDEGFNPPLYVEARVYEQTRSIKSQAKKDIKLGDYVEYTEEEVNALWAELRREIQKKIDIETLHNYAEPRKVESDEEPEIKDGENPIWVDTSNEFKTPHVVIAGEWQPMSPDEKVIADADRLKEGIVDVGAVPLRTSQTGARIEWDGVNGLVQYNRDEEPKSWLDLEGNAHFENAYISGRIEALEGYIGDNISITDDGGIEIVRDDGAISSENGMISGGEPLTPYDPHYMRMGRHENGSFKAFTDVYDSWWRAEASTLDGRGEKGTTGVDYEDRRDEMNAVVFQRYTFIHKARYMVFDFQKNSSSGVFSVHIMKGTSVDEDERVYFEKLEKTSSSKKYSFIVDLGTPNFKEKDFSLKIGWTKSWIDKGEFIIFRILKSYQTDFIDDL